MNAKMVSSLFKIDGDSNKQKTLNTIRVMKGAISVSKSRTGEVIYHSNKQESEGLQRQIKGFERSQSHLKSTYDSKKRTTLRRWTLVFEKQKSMNESIREFDSLLTQAIADVDKNGSKTQSYEEKECLKLDLARMRPDDDDAIYEEEVERMMKQRGIKKIRLQPIGVGKNSQIKVESAEPEVDVIKEELWPLRDTRWINNYIRGQKVKHESLITKNMLKKIREGLASRSTLYRFRLRANLADDPNDTIETIKSARAAKTAPIMPSVQPTLTQTTKKVMKPSTTTGSSLDNDHLPPVNMFRRSQTLMV